MFTCVPLQETIEIALDYAYEKSQTVNGLPRSKLKELLVFATSQTNFIFNGQSYDQIDGVAMGSPLAPVLANLFMRRLEETAMDTYAGEKPLYYRRYVDDSFLIFERSSHVLPFFEHMNNQHPNIKFTKEEENGEYFAFLDIKIRKENNCFTTSTYYKPCLLYTSPSPRDRTRSRMPSSA